MAEDNEWVETIPEPYRENESIVNAGSMEGLLDMHVNLEKKMGTALFAPGEGADDEQMNSFYSKVNELAPGLTRIPTGDDEEGMAALYNKLGRPEESAGYEVPEVKGPDGKPIEAGEYIDDFKEFAHSTGITKDQFAKVLTFFGERTAKNMEDAQTARTELMNNLKTEWGDATDGRVARVEKLITEQGGEEAFNAMGDVLANPVALKMFDKLAEAVMEEGSLDGDKGANTASTRTQIEDEMATLKGNAAYFDKKNPDHERVVSRVNALAEKLENYKAA